jgi:hypothetical protein
MKVILTKEEGKRIADYAAAKEVFESARLVAGPVLTKLVDENWQAGLSGQIGLTVDGVEISRCASIWE